MFTREMKKGSTDLLILALLAGRPRHGYEIGKLIELRSGGRLQFRIASLYPILCRLEKKGLISGRWVEKEGERRRRFYRLTASGRRELKEQRSLWNEFIAALNPITGLKVSDWRSYVRERLDLSGLGGSRAEEIVEEVAQQMEDAYQEAIKRGATEEAARATAESHITDWKGFSQEIQRTKAERSVAISESIEYHAHNLRPGFRFLILEFLGNVLYASRTLRKNQRFTAVVILTITLGIGAT